MINVRTRVIRSTINRLYHGTVGDGIGAVRGAKFSSYSIQKLFCILESSFLGDGGLLVVRLNDFSYYVNRVMVKRGGVREEGVET